MVKLCADQLVCIDKASFNKRSGWRRAVYAPIGHDGCYQHDVRVGRTWNILSAYTIEGYLPGIGIKKRHYTAEDFYRWIVDELLP